ncbi:MAG: response regulator [Pirellulales bacterium]|jgi:PleD family two-component response regulator
MRKLLIVGQCDFDYQRIRLIITKSYEIEVHRADSWDDALQSALDIQFDLIMINRLLDTDRSEGMAVLHELKSNPATENTPAMIISDYQETQGAAVAAGAKRGFGKASLDAPETFELLSVFLTD